MVADITLLRFKLRRYARRRLLVRQGCRPFNTRDDQIAPIAPAPCSRLSPRGLYRTTLMIHSGQRIRTLGTQHCGGASMGHSRRSGHEAPGRRSGSRTGADVELRRWQGPPTRPRSRGTARLERLLMPLSGHPIAIALQRFRFGLPSRPGPERRRDGFRSDVESQDTPTPAIEPEPRRRKEIARRRRQPAEAARRFFLQIFQVVFAPTPGDTTIDFEPDRFRLHVARWQHVREREIAALSSVFSEARFRRWL